MYTRGVMMRMRWVMVVLFLWSCGGADEGEVGGGSGSGASGGTEPGTGGDTGCQLVSAAGDDNSCGYVWSCPDGEHALSCAPDTVTTSTTCTCSLGGNLQSDFYNVHLCPYGNLGFYTPEDVAWIANNACGWTIPTTGGPDRWACTETNETVTENACSWSWSCAVGAVQYGCDSGGSGYFCDCTINGTNTFSASTGTFCDAIVNGTWPSSTPAYRFKSDCGLLLP